MFWPPVLGVVWVRRKRLISLDNSESIIELQPRKAPRGNVGWSSALQITDHKFQSTKRDFLDSLIGWLNLVSREQERFPPHHFHITYRLSAPYIVISVGRPSLLDSDGLLVVGVLNIPLAKSSNGYICGRSLRHISTRIALKLLIYCT